MLPFPNASCFRTRILFVFLSHYTRHTASGILLFCLIKNAAERYRRPAAAFPDTFYKALILSTASTVFS